MLAWRSWELRAKESQERQLTGTHGDDGRRQRGRRRRIGLIHPREGIKKEKEEGA
jgi:hypothetical protein